VITQNVDNLHQDSGVPEGKIIELHMKDVNVPGRVLDGGKIPE